MQRKISNLFSREEIFQTHKIHVISIDMVGEIPPLMLIEQIKPFLGLPMTPEFNEQMKKLAQKLGIKVRFGMFIYPGSDFANWFLHGHKANWLMTPSKYLHSAQDVADNVNQDLLNECLRLFTAYLLERS